MQTHDYDFNLSKENFGKALEAIKGLAGKETIKDSSGAHFRWVDTRKFLRAETLEDAFRAWRWAIDIDENTGDAVAIEFEGDKLGDDEKFFKAIAPFVEDGSYIDMIGEDGYAWRWLFGGGKLKEISGEIVFREDDD